MSSQLSVGDIVTLQKPHQCGGFAREILQLSGYFGIIRCLTCGEISTKYISDIKRNVKNTGFDNQENETLAGASRMEIYDDEQLRNNPLVSTSEYSINCVPRPSYMADIKTNSVEGERIDNFFSERCFKIFREFCSRSKLVYMKDLYGFDFGKLIRVRGIGVGKVGQIKERWSEYSTKPLDLDKGMLIISRNIVDVPRRAIAEVMGADDPLNSQMDTRDSCFNTSLRGITDLNEGKAGIRQILAAHFQTLHGYSNINILWSAAQSSLPMFLNDNAINSPGILWDLLNKAFEGEYVFSEPHIWQKKPDYPQNVVGIVINFARQQGGIVTREQIDDYFSGIKINAPINSNILKQELLLFYENRKFILSETVDLSQARCDAVTRALDKLFTLENVAYIVLRDITVEWFSHLPEIRGGIPWTALLLQEVLRVCPKIGYRVIFSGLDGQSLDTLGAAIVPDKSDVKTFADVVHRFCYEKCALPIKMPTEKLRITLREAGMLDGNELIYNLHKALKDHRFGFTDENRTVKILER